MAELNIRSEVVADYKLQLKDLMSEAVRECYLDGYRTGFEDGYASGARDIANVVDDLREKGQIDSSVCAKLLSICQGYIRDNSKKSLAHESKDLTLVDKVLESRK